MSSLRDRLRKLELSDLPPHSWRESSADSGRCMACPLPEVHPIHRAVSRLVELDRLDEGDDEDLVDEEVHTSVMIALFPDLETAKTLKLPGGEKARALHVTLAYLGDADNVGDVATLVETVARVASESFHLTGEISGLGVFTAGEGAVTYASVDVPGLSPFRERLVEAVEQAGFVISRDHGFTPHMTLAYGDKRAATVPNLPLHFPAITVAIRGQMTSFPLGLGDPAELVAAEPVLAADEKKKEPKGTLVKGAGKDEPHKYKRLDVPDEDGVAPPCETCERDEIDPIHGGKGVGDLVDATSLFVHDRKVGPTVLREAESAEGPLSRAFVSDVNGKTFITGQAAAFSRITPQWEKALGPNPHMLWMAGRFVGAEKANRNGAYWSTGDLEMGNPTVKYGPLNWLHEARHVIGVIADSQLRTHDIASDKPIDEPYIEAASGIWRWIYPDEAYVIEQASDANKLWYSMECISSQVECVGEGSCGSIVGYFDYMKGVGTCAHMKEHSAIRRLVDPIFLGGAVIVPPVRPGWAEADARVLSQATSMAEKSFADAGQPDVPASEWEQMMAQIVRQAA